MSFPHSSRIAAMLLAALAHSLEFLLFQLLQQKPHPQHPFAMNLKTVRPAAEKSIRKLGRATPKKTAAVKITT